MSKQYKLSVIIPVFDTNINYLEECFLSIDKQTYQNFEVILVNDCSKKFATAQFINQYPKTHDKYRVINLSQGFGPGNARNVGVENSTGEIIVFIDSDDYLLPKCFEVINNTFNQWPDLDFLSFEIKILMSNGELYDPTTNRVFSSTPTNVSENPNFANTRCSVWAKGFSKIFLIENNIWFKKEDMYMEDLYYHMLLLSKSKKTIYINDVLYILRETVNSRALSEFNAKKANDIFHCYTEAYKEIENDNSFLSNNFAEYFKNSFFSKIDYMSKFCNFKQTDDYKKLVNEANKFLFSLTNTKA